jgi:hypothetical protein
MSTILKMMKKRFIDTTYQQHNTLHQANLYKTNLFVFYIFTTSKITPKSLSYFRKLKLKVYLNLTLYFYYIKRIVKYQNLRSKIGKYPKFYAPRNWQYQTQNFVIDPSHVIFLTSLLYNILVCGSRKWVVQGQEGNFCVSNQVSNQVLNLVSSSSRPEITSYIPSRFCAIQLMI